MKQIARYGRSVARPGRGDDLARHLLAAAAELEGDPGCELYLVNRQRDDPDTIWVTELWRSQADLDASIERIKGSPEVAAVMELVERWEVVELDLLGGKGVAGARPAGAAPYTIHTLTDSEDAAAKNGFGEIGEARFVTGDLATEATGLAHHRMRPSMRQPFGHRHEQAEEVYVVLSGSGRVKLDDEIAEVGPLQAIRVAAPVTRAFEAGPDGLELLVFGPHHPRDGELVQNWWTD
jgi:mannose-6-phosphate isomerase-like protein (cupin superfamily)